MEFSIVSIRKNEIIPPNSNYQMDFMQNQLACFKVDDCLFLSKQTKLEPGDLIIGRKIRLSNIDTKFIGLSGFVFSLSKINQDREPVIIRKNTDELLTERFCYLANGVPYTKLLEEINGILSYIYNLFVEASDKEIKSENIVKSTGTIDKRLIIINRYIRHHFGEPLTLQTLAELIQCNPTYLSNTYSRVFKISPMRYLQNIRMVKAKEFLLEPDCSVSEAANRLGYISSSQFSELFKRYYQVTPTQYRVSRLLGHLNKGNGE